MVVKVVSKNRRTHLIAVVRGMDIFSTAFRMCSDLVTLVPEAEGRPEFESPWFVFNDFVVHNISESEALSFTGKWKVVFLMGPSYIRGLNDISGPHHPISRASRCSRGIGLLGATRRNRSFNPQSRHVHIAVRTVPP